MDMNTRTIALWSGVAILFISGIVVLFLSFGGSNNSPAEDLNAVYTNAALTIEAQQQTLQAGLHTPTPTLASGSSTAALTLLPTATLLKGTPALLPTAIVAPGSGGGGATGCDNSVYLSDVTVPDGTTIAAGQNFTKTWKVSNTGSCTWTATYQLVFVSGDSLGGKATPIGVVVKPGEAASVSVILTSSSATGNLTGIWRLSNDKSQPFGDRLTVVVNSSGATTGTVTPTPTRTPTPAAVTIIVVTASYTPTPTSTPVVAPTNTPTPTPTPTNTPGGSG